MEVTCFLFLVGGAAAGEKAKETQRSRWGMEKKMERARAPVLREREREGEKVVCANKQIQGGRANNICECSRVLLCALDGGAEGVKSEKEIGVRLRLALPPRPFFSRPPTTRPRPHAKHLLTPWIEHGTFGLQDQRTTTVLRQREG